MDMTKDIFADQLYGQLALEKIKPSSPNFRLYMAGFIENGGPPESWEVMEVVGAEFREAKSGPNKGKLCVMVPNTKRTAHIHVSEMRARDTQKTPSD
ncbi:hypothetical protein [Ralstonia sp. ASV6]|uniref:hypothetical protein n=1 Tax=Ralstonia sp. ASV6 TaxID=2795124 RepID=UPI0018EA5AA6|nr:hypothetical protein [Ralstonia sp. ASV6]